MSNNAEFNPYPLVQEFITAFDADTSINLWATLVTEELTELIEAMALDITDGTQQSLENVLKEACDVYYVLTGFAIIAGPYGVDLSDKLAAEATKVLAPVLDIFGHEKVHEAFHRVHQSNMSKLGDDGKPVRREDGKILKGPNYKPPVLSDLVFPVYVLTNTAPVSPSKN